MPVLLRTRSSKPNDCDPDRSRYSHPYAYSSLPHANASLSEDCAACFAPVRLLPPVYIYRCQYRTELEPTYRSQASRFYSTDKSVVHKYCFQTYAPYPSMGFDPLQGAKRAVVPVSLTDDLKALHSHIAGQALAELSSTASRPRQSLTNLPKQNRIKTYAFIHFAGHLKSEFEMRSLIKYTEAYSIKELRWKVCPTRCLTPPTKLIRTIDPAEAVSRVG